MIFKRFVNRLYELYITGLLYIGTIGYIRPSTRTIQFINTSTPQSGDAILEFDTTQNWAATAGARLFRLKTAGVTQFEITEAGRVDAKGLSMTGTVTIGGQTVRWSASGQCTAAYSSPNLDFTGTDAIALRVQAGTGAARASFGGAISVNTTAVGNVGAGEDDLMTYSLPANSLVTTGRGVKITAWGTTANNANAKTLKIYFGSAIATVSLTTSVSGKWYVVAHIIRTGSSTQDYVVRVDDSGANTPTIANGALTETETAAITIKCTGEATADNDIVQEGMLVEYV